jgi:hypothetical protein
MNYDWFFNGICIIVLSLGFYEQYEGNILNPDFSEKGLTFDRPESNAQYMTSACTQN